jgi:hypothetical protein
VNYLLLLASYTFGELEYYSHSILYMIHNYIFFGLEVAGGCMHILHLTMVISFISDISFVEELTCTPCMTWLLAWLASQKL